ncbi:MAG: DUF3090 family protein [Dehalococcoidia bacterium]|jgi:hypothetical protein|nr:DUF3090 family protein [Dehalococcoidia bacterium]
MDREKYLNLGKCLQIMPQTFGKPGNRTFLLEIYCEDHFIKLWLEKQQLALISQEIKKYEPFTSLTTQNLNVEESESKFEYKLVDFAVEFQSNSNLIDFYIVAVDLDDKNIAATFSYENKFAQNLAKDSLIMVSKGRPICNLCFTPVNEDGHFCIKLNGHIENVKIG